MFDGLCVLTHTNRVLYVLPNCSCVEELWHVCSFRESEPLSVTSLLYCTCSCSPFLDSAGQATSAVVRPLH